MMRFPSTASLRLVTASLLLAACSSEPSLPTVSDARFKEPLPGKTVVAGYFNLHNPTAEPLILSAVTANVGNSVEIHRTIRSGDQVRMERLKRLTVAPGETLRFEPGSYHLMLFGIEALPEATEVTLTFEGAPPVASPFRAEPW